MTHRFIPCLLMALVVACSRDTSLQRFTPPDVDARSRDYLGHFVRGQTDSALDRLISPLRTPDAAIKLRKITDILRNERFDTIRVIGRSRSKSLRSSRSPASRFCITSGYC